MELNIRQIQEIIPHRYPFLLIDKVLDVKPNEKLVAVKNVTVNEPFFVGHFPNEKVMPGVLILEAMAQAGCIYFYFSKGLHGKSLIYYLGKVEAKFMQPVVPGDQLKIEISSVKLMSKAGILKGKAFVKDKLVTEAEVAFGVKEI